MSDQAERFAVARAGMLAMPDPSKRRKVLMALAEAHTQGPLRIDSGVLARRAGLRPLDFCPVMLALHRTRMLQAANIGSLMTVVFAFDYPEDHPEFVATPAAREART